MSTLFAWQSQVKQLSLNPVPPFILGTMSTFQATQWSELRSKELLHQYFAMIDMRFLHTFFVSLKQLILYVGIAWITIFKNTSLPGHERNLSQALILHRMHSTVWSKGPACNPPHRRWQAEVPLCWKTSLPRMIWDVVCINTFVSLFQNVKRFGMQNSQLKHPIYWGNTKEKPRYMWSPDIFYCF
jgi:hypothetical protein